MRCILPADVIRRFGGVSVLVLLVACGSASHLSGGPEPGGVDATTRQRAANRVLLNCVMDALPAGFALVPVRNGDAREAVRPIRVERNSPIEKGERFERITIGVSLVPESDSLRLGFYNQSGTYVNSQGTYTLDEPPLGTVRQAANAIQAACGHLTVASAI